MALRHDVKPLEGASDLRISTWNVNGLRSAFRKGFDAWLASSNNDIVCLQEVRMQEDLLTGVWFSPYQAYWNGGSKRGYSGVATLVNSHFEPVNVTLGMQDEMLDPEGRILTTDFKSFVLVNAYAPHSHRKLTRLEAKLRFCESFLVYTRSLMSRGTPVIIVGDLNVAHTEIDLSNPTANRNNAGFLQVERDWMTALIGEGLMDAFRIFCTGTGHYTWWSTRKGIRERNVGWRLDYILVDKILADRVVACFHSPHQFGSDHCPVTMDIRI